jgi:hypothetical protein
MDKLAGMLVWQRLQQHAVNDAKNRESSATSPSETGVNRRLLQFMHVVEHAARDANNEHGQVAPSLVLHAARHVHDHILVEFDFFIVEAHPALAIEHVVNLVRALMIMQLGVGDLQVMDLRRCAVLLFQERTDLAARLGPRLHVGHVSP